MKKFQDLTADEQKIHQLFLDTILRLRSTTLNEELFSYTLTLVDKENNNYGITFDRDSSQHILVYNNSKPTKFNPTAISGIMNFISNFDYKKLTDKLLSTTQDF